MDSVPVSFLGSATRAATGAPNGGWATFLLTVDPNRPSGDRLIAQINGVDVYRGNIPTGGPVSGAVQFGFRENHTGAPVSTEGTWVDNVRVSLVSFPVSVSSFQVE
jgi:hypothetical protein